MQQECVITIWKGKINHFTFVGLYIVIRFSTIYQLNMYQSSPLHVKLIVMDFRSIESLGFKVTRVWRLYCKIEYFEFQMNFLVILCNHKIEFSVWRMCCKISINLEFKINSNDCVKKKNFLVILYNHKI
jgi:hypothetical protein